MVENLSLSAIFQPAIDPHTLTLFPYFLYIEYQD